MSLRDRNSLVTTGISPNASAGSLRQAANNAAIARPTGRGLAAIEKASSFSASAGKKGNIAFVFDATGSRESVWKPAKEAFQQMFLSMHGQGSMQLKFMDFGNVGDAVDREWTTDVNLLCKQVQDVECRGGTTQINDCLRQLVSPASFQKPNSVVYVGDHFEEDFDDLKETIQIMRQNNVKVFTFLDSTDPHAEKAYRMLAEETGGKFAVFDHDNLKLQDLCEGVALLTVGGQSALSRLKSAEARNLLLSGPSVR